MLQFVTLFLFQFWGFFNILPDFAANIFFSPSRLQAIYFVFQSLQTIFFKISQTPFQKYDGSSLSHDLLEDRRIDDVNSNNLLPFII